MLIRIQYMYVNSIKTRVNNMISTKIEFSTDEKQNCYLFLTDSEKETWSFHFSLHSMIKESILRPYMVDSNQKC